MPKINITLNDNTGAEYTSDEQVVFVPGSVRIQAGKADDNNCVYIAAADASKVTNIFEYTEADAKKLADAEVLKAEAARVLEDAESNEATAKNAHTLAVKAEKEAKEAHDKEATTDTEAAYKEAQEATQTAKTAWDTAKAASVKAKDDLDAATSALIDLKASEASANCLAMIDTYLAAGLDVLYCYLAPNADGSPAEIKQSKKVDFLKDKDNYNVKFLTAGVKETIAITNYTAATETSNASITFNFEVQNALEAIAADRKDCMVVASVGYNTEELEKIGITKGDQLAECVKRAVTPTTGTRTPVEVEDAEIDIKVETGLDSTRSQFGYLIVPNLYDTLTSKIAGSRKFTIPGSLAYLVAAGRCLKNNQDWMSVANTARGTVSYAPDLKVTKYFMDKSVIEDDQGVSFNGIVTVRPSAKVIWGDRTLLESQGTVKASSYMSLMLLICDISKRAYNAAVKCTYESNNEVTWLNYKSRIAELLDEAVASGVLQTYDITKGKSDTYNTVVCKIKIYPNLPVENFDITIDVENAELTVENA